MYMICMIIFIAYIAVENVTAIGGLFWQNGIIVAKCNIMGYR